MTSWRLSRLLSLIGFVVPVLGAGVWFGRELIGPALTGALAGAVLLWQLTLLVAWPRLAWGAFRYEVREHDLLVQSGVLFRRWSSVPLTRIQYVDTEQGPLERMLGLAHLKVYTAAGMSADGSVPGLALADAERLRDALSRRGSDDGV
jgi:membrane protein YdbS with pleckstrin-like domain